MFINIENTVFNKKLIVCFRKFDGANKLFYNSTKFYVEIILNDGSDDGKGYEWEFDTEKERDEFYNFYLDKIIN